MGKIGNIKIQEQQDDSLDSLEHLVAECSAALRLVKEQAGHQERLVKDQVGRQHLQPQDEDDQTPSLKPLAKVGGPRLFLMTTPATSKYNIFPRKNFHILICFILIENIRNFFLSSVYV